MLLLLMGYGVAGAPPAVVISFEGVTIRIDDVGLYIEPANVGWSIASGDVGLYVEKG